MSSWCVVNTRPNQEIRAEVNLKRQGFKVWLPRLHKSRNHARRRDVVQAPFFPGYLFVQLDPEQDQWGSINHSFGVKNVLTNGRIPSILPEGFVGALQQELQSDDARETVQPVLSPGDKVRISVGPFVDYVATVAKQSAQGRVSLLLEVLGRAVPASLSRTSVVPIT